MSPASVSASQAKADDNKADAASPFALLVEMAAAKNPAKPPKKDDHDSDNRYSDNKKSDEKSAAQQGDKAASAQTLTQPKPAASAKASGKPDKNKDEDTKETADEQQVAAVEQQMSDQQALPPAPVAPAPIAASAIADTDTEEDIQIGAASPMAAAPSCNTDLPQPDSMPVPDESEAAATAQTAPRALLAAQSDDSQIEDSEAPETSPSAAAQTAPGDAKPLVASKDGEPAAVKTVAKNDPAGTVKQQAADTERAKNDLADSAAAAAVKDSDDRLRDSVPVKAAKDDGASNVALKDRTAHAGGNDSTKTDTSALDAQKLVAPQPDARPMDTDIAAAPDAAKPPPQFASGSNAMFAINAITAPQAAQNNQAPMAAQHVQVSAQAAPNLPALAVEISAKSQSGAKQFDIRLDPPELGRVEVRLSIDATGKASAHLSADQPQTLHLLQKDAPILTRALREAGLDVSQDGLNFSLRHQGQGQGGNDGNNGRFGSARAFPLTATASIDPAAAAIAYRGVIDGRLDIRV
jgi:flagellar hook-length control protein FliK